MAKQIASKNSKPDAWIVSPKDRGRKSIKNGKCFLENNETFEIELFNPLTVSVLADIKLNGQSISKTGLVIKPGQRVYLDCFIDDRKKFKFSTYEIEADLEAINATQNNGLLEVFFYKEDVITLDNWQRRFEKIIVEKHYYPYNQNPWYNPYNIYCENSNLVYKDLLTNNNNISYGGTTVNNLFTTNSIGYSTNLNSQSIETGRVEKGEKSSQKFTEVDMDFEKNYITSTIIQILPKSIKPTEIKEVKGNLNKVMLKDLKKESDDVIELIKKLADLHSSGILTDEEFSEKKKELLNKI
jgi:hypothetical protein